MKEVSNLKERLREQRPASWETLPDIPLYMDQVLSLMSRQTIRFGEEDALTAAMVNNYIKDGVVPRAEENATTPSIWRISPWCACSSRCWR